MKTTAPKKRTKRPATKTERVDRTIDLSLLGEDVDRLIRTLNADEQELFWLEVDKIRSSQVDDQAKRDLWKIDYERVPPTMDEFLDDDYWVGRVTRAGADSAGVYPEWRKVLVRDWDLDSRVHNAVFTGSLGTGKCVKKGTPIRMADGSVKLVEDIKIGDQVMGDDGTPRNVLDLARGREQMYDIIPFRPKKGLVWGCNASHILVLKSPKGGLVTVTADEVFKNRKKYSVYRLVRSGFELPEKPVPVDPYWLGLWIGDGLASSTSLTVCDKDPEISKYNAEYALSLGMRVSVSKPKGPGKCARYHRIRGETVWKNPLRGALRSLGLTVKIKAEGGSKFIPKDYACNSQRVRKLILAGIIDTDGGMDSNCYDISLADEYLALQVRDLAWSLGAQVSLVKRTIKNKKFKKDATAWRLCISGIELPTLVARRKVVRVAIGKRNGMNRRTKGVTGFNIVDHGLGDYYGFVLDGNHRFLIADGTVTHNTWNAMIVMAYRVVLARLLRNPAAFLGLSRGAMIFYAILSISRSVVEETAFGDLKNFMANSPFFTEVCRYNPDKLYASLRIPIGKNIYVTGGSRGQHIIGRNAMGCAMDEGNFRLEANPDLRAYALYDEIRNRIKNRFQRITGFLPAVSLLSSSAKDQSSFTERVIAEIKSAPPDDTQKVYSYAVYEIKPGLTLSGRYFKVAYGSRTVDPRVLSGFYLADGTPIEDGEGGHEAPPSGTSTKLVPTDYLDEFKRNVRTALQSVTGVSTGGSFKLFSSSVDLERAVTLGQQAGLADPCRVASIPLSDEDDKEIWDYLNHREMLAIVQSEVVPKRDPWAKRFIHIDLAKRTQAGFAVCHRVGKTRVENKYREGSGEVFSKYDHVVEFDVILSIVAGKSKPISIKKILNFVYWLRDIAKYQVALTTADQYNSLLPLQLLEGRRFKVANLSVDRSKKPYYALRSAYEEGRLRMFTHKLLVDELENLVDTDKIDHPSGGSKDVADAVAGSCYSAISLTDTAEGDPDRGHQPSIYTSLDAKTEKPPIDYGQLAAQTLKRPKKRFNA